MLIGPRMSFQIPVDNTVIGYDFFSSCFAEKEFQHVPTKSSRDTIISNGDENEQIFETA